MAFVAIGITIVYLIISGIVAAIVDTVDLPILVLGLLAKLVELALVSGFLSRLLELETVPYGTLISLLISAMYLYISGKSSASLANSGDELSVTLKFAEFIMVACIIYEVL